MAKIGFYLDENVPTAVADQLRHADILVFSAHELGLLGADDTEHLSQALIRGCVLCTHDTDFLVLAQLGAEHAGIIWSPHANASIGGWVRILKQLHANEMAENLRGQVRMISAK